REWHLSEGVIILKLGDESPALCPRCQQPSRELYQRGPWRKVYHGFGFGRRVYLLIRKDRYFCSSCKLRFTKSVPLVYPWQRRTEEAERQIIGSLRGRSFRSVEQKEGVSYGVSRRILMRRVDPEKLLWKEESPQELALGIDDHSFRGVKLVHTVTDLSHHAPLTILPDSRQQTLDRFLNNIPQEQKPLVKEVCIDMDSLLLRSVEKTLPEAKVVVDHFHLIQDANHRLDEARKIEQEGSKVEIPRKLFLMGKEKLKPAQKRKVEAWCQKYPSLKEFYWMKEALRAFYRLKDKKAAARRLKDLIQMALHSDDGAMMHWGRMLQRWDRYILNYFDNRTTNAYTEGIHTKIKMIKRVSFGFRNVQVYIRKVLLCLFPLATILSLPHFSL
ncbi:ISL3 family transposase, partial [bacterium]